MAKQVSSAGERETGEAKVILACLDVYAPLAQETAVLKNPVPGLKKDWWKSLSVRRKDPSKFHTSPRDVFLNSGLDRSFQEKNSPNADVVRFLPVWRNTAKNERQNRPSVTTSHLFWPNERRSHAFLLPIRLPNPSFLALSDRTRPGGGISGTEPPKVPYR